MTTLIAKATEELTTILNDDNPANLIDADRETIENIIVSSGKEFRITPSISEKYRKNTEFILTLSNEPIEIELCYRIDHGPSIFKGIQAAVSNCSNVLECLVGIFPSVHFYVRTGRFNARDVPYSVVRKTVEGRYVFYIDLHSRFNMDNLSFLARAIWDKACEVQ